MVYCPFYKTIFRLYKTSAFSNKIQFDFIKQELFFLFRKANSSTNLENQPWSQAEEKGSH